MRLPRSLMVPPLLVSGVLVSGCGATEDSASPGEALTSATCGDGCLAERRAQRRAARQARDAERCRDLLSGVALTYRITATPQADGRAIGLHMALVNRSEARLSGSTFGVLKIAPGPRSNRISWGGSSAEELWQEPGTASRREIWHDRRPPGWHPVGTHVTSFHFSTYAYVPGARSCFIPATVLAPRGLVDGHPSGHWIQDSDAP